MSHPHATLLPIPHSPADLTPAWMTEALAPGFPGELVAETRLAEIASGTNLRVSVALSYSAGDGPERVLVKLPGRPLHRLALLALGALTTEARLFASSAELPLEHARAFAAAVDSRRLAGVVVLARGMRRARRRADRRLLPAGASARLLERQFRASAALAATGPQTLLHG
ncbi:MAG: hypothetical protein ACYCSI_06855, partial [Solirubrobacteraceae bacterium]